MSRRPLDFEDYVDVVRRHRSWIVGPVFAAAVVSVVAAFLWPDTYISYASLQVVPPVVSERYVPSNINSEMTQRINLMAQKLRSRDYLTNVRTSYKLYPDAHKPLEDVLDDMNRAIIITPVTSVSLAGRAPVSAFRVSFEYSNRFVAQKVTQQLVGGFIDENVRAMTSQSAATTDFLKDQWEEAGKRLHELEDKMAAFRMKNTGRLPDQLQANLQALSALQTQLASVNETISRISQDKLRLEADIRIARDQLANFKQPAAAASAAFKNEQLVQIERQIAGLEASLASLRERYKENYPDVKTAEGQLAALRRQRDSLFKQDQAPKPPAGQPAAPPVDSPATNAVNVAIARMQTQVQAKDIEMEERVRQQKKLMDMITTYNNRIEQSPLSEREFSDLTRELDLARKNYEELNAKKSMSETATTLENQGRGEQLQLLEPASLPERPAKPNRWVIVGVGLSLGLLIGAAVAGVREVKDTSLKSLKDARAYTHLPVLGTIPLLENDLVVRRKRRLAWLAWSAAGVLGVVAMSTAIYYHFSTKM